MTQEKIMKDRMIRAIILFLLTLIALLVFIGLYIDETNRVQETYHTQFNDYLGKTTDAIDNYLNAEGDLPLRYRDILSDFSSANSFGFLMTSISDEHKSTINELHACLLKYPEQMQDRKKMEDMREALTDISKNLDKGFDEAAKIVDSVDKKGH